MVDYDYLLECTSGRPQASGLMIIVVGYELGMLCTSGRLHDTHLSPIPLKLGDSSPRWHLSDLGPLRDTHLAVFRLK